MAENHSARARELDDRIAELRKQILALAAGQRVEAFFGEMEGMNPEQVLRELEQVEGR